MDCKNLSIPDVARMSGLPDSTIRSIISRKNKTVALEVAFKLAKGLNVSLEELNGETFEENATTEKLIFNNLDDATTKNLEEASRLFNDLSPELQEYALEQLKGLLKLQENTNQSQIGVLTQNH